MMCYFLDENDEKMKNIVKVAVVEAIEQALTPAVQDFHECVNEALKSHMSHQAFIKKAVEGALFNEILGFLQCVICRETSNPPIIGCQQCAKTWMQRRRLQLCNNKFTRFGRLSWQNTHLISSCFKNNNLQFLNLLFLNINIHSKYTLI